MQLHAAERWRLRRLQQVRRFKYHGGTFKRFPARITVPETGPWNIIIDLAGAKSEIQYNITVVIE